MSVSSGNQTYLASSLTAGAAAFESLSSILDEDLATFWSTIEAFASVGLVN
jgi:hypothetical protein